MSQMTGKVVGGDFSLAICDGVEASRGPTRPSVLCCLGAALAIGFASTGSAASTTTWSGAATEAPYWDLAINWSDGAPVAPDTEVQLLYADTELRTGSYQAARVEGLGQLTVSGGQLHLHGDGSSVDRLNLSGGRLSGRGTLTVGQLHWGGGEITGLSGTAAAPRLAITRGASITGSHVTRVMPAGGALTLGGHSLWAAGDMHVFSPLTIPQGATLVDRGHDREHELRLHADTEFAGIYRKELGHATRVQIGANAAFRNSGSIVTEGGYFQFRGGESWENTGQVFVGRTSTVNLFELSETRWNNAGRIQVGGELSARISRHGMKSSGSWVVTKGGRARFVADRTAPEIVFEQGIQNHGSVTFEGDPRAPWREISGRYRMEGAGLTGTGTVWVRGAHVELGDEYVNRALFVLNSGEVRVDRYVQDAAGSSTGLSGLLRAPEVMIADGKLNTSGYLTGGIDGNLILGSDATFEALSSAYRTTLLQITGTATLDGTVLIHASSSLRPGSHRLLHAAGGIAGSFDELVTDADPERYLLTLSYGADWVALNVAAVPEPETYALMAVGIAALMLRRRRSQSARGAV